MSRLDWGRRWIAFVWFAAAIALLGISRLGAGETALDRYVAKPDPTYSWKVVRTVPGNPLTQYIVDLKSQTWRTEKDVDRPVWQHWLTIAKPANPAPKLAFLRITGGANGSEVSSLPYKGITGFKNYPATSAISDYNFEFRDAATGALIGTYDVTGINSLLYGFNNTRLHRNLTLALLGLPGDPVSLKIMLIESYTNN